MRATCAAAVYSTILLACAPGASRVNSKSKTANVAVVVLSGHWFLSKDGSLLSQGSWLNFACQRDALKTYISVLQSLPRSFHDQEKLNVLYSPRSYEVQKGVSASSALFSLCVSIASPSPFFVMEMHTMTLRSAMLASEPSSRLLTRLGAPAWPSASHFSSPLSSPPSRSAEAPVSRSVAAPLEVCPEHRSAL
jgi:hypothetical protein